MKTKNILKALALAMLMSATMLLTTACSSDDLAVNNEPTAKQGFEIPVTVNVTRQDNAATRATYNEGTKKLSFSPGDKLYVHGKDGSTGGAGEFAGVLDYNAGNGKFSGTIYTENPYSGTGDALFTAVTASASASNYVGAQLLPNGYGSKGFLSISGSGYSAKLNLEWTKAFAATKAEAVEQFSTEYADGYNSFFALKPMFAILHFTVIGLTANTSVDVAMRNINNNPSDATLYLTGSVTTDASGTASFAMALADYSQSLTGKQMSDFILKVGNYDNITFGGSSNILGGTIYNFAKSVGTANTVYLNQLTDDYTAQNGDILKGTLGGDYKISIADGATVVLHGATIFLPTSNSSSKNWAGITCNGNATIILSGVNQVRGFNDDYPGIIVAQNKTLIIKGDGKLMATGGYSAAGIGAGNKSDIICGNIEIQGGTITATGGGGAAGIGGGYGLCGTVTISGGIVTATGGHDAAGIGGGCHAPGTCGTVTITSGVTKVTATKGGNFIESGGKESIGKGLYSTCGTVTIDGVTNATPSSTFTNFTSSWSDPTWTLTHN